MRRDLGDFQTPPDLAAAVLGVLGPIGERWPRVLEPTCGRGHFLSGLIGGPSPPREVRGIEVQEAYCEAARAVAVGAPSTRVEVLRANVFEVDLRRDLAWTGGGPLLVVGNPPWVTSAALGTLGSTNHPPKSNVKKLRGIDARTGASNFDIAEAVWLKLIGELAEEEATIALLCKTSVARNVLRFAEEADLPIAAASLFRVDARRWFGAAVEACLFLVRLAPGPRAEHVPVFGGLEPAGPGRMPESTLGLVGGRLVADLDAYRPRAYADGRCPMTWRQGLKHDAAAVMELTVDPDSGRLRNKLGTPVDVEPDWVYPLVKGAGLLGAASPARSVIVPQRRIGQDTRRLEHEAPRLWAYLEAHAPAFARRKSSIYRGRPPFAIFGIGPYSFAPYKVAISGLGKSPRFHALGPVGRRPVMLDDTCYFLPCRSPEQAALVSALLNDPDALGLIDALIFREGKRPITKALLQRLDLDALAARVDRASLLARAEDTLGRLFALEAEPLAIDYPVCVRGAHASIRPDSA